MRLGSENNPVSEAEIERLRQNVRRSFTNHGGELADDRVKGDPILQDSDFVAAYVYKLTRYGKPMTYIGYSNVNAGKESVRDVHDTARQYREVYRRSSTLQEFGRRNQKKRKETSDSGGFSTQAAYLGPFRKGDQWKRLGVVTPDKTVKPYGRLKATSWAYKLGERYEGRQNDLYATTAVTIFLPGSHYWGNSWRTQNVRPGHRWSRALFGNSSTYNIAQIQPANGHTGSQSYSVSLTGGTAGIEGSIGWTFTQPAVSRYILTNNPDNRRDARWKFVPNTSRTRTARLQFKVGSKCWLQNLGKVCSTLGPVDLQASFTNGIFSKSLGVQAGHSFC